MRVAGKEQLCVAYSNQAFELWYLLHFDYCDTALSRHSYGQRLNEKLGIRYQKNDSSLYGRLLDRQADAIKNAANLLAQYDSRDPAEDNPSTTVHLLVKELVKYSRR